MTNWTNIKGLFSVGCGKAFLFDNHEEVFNAAFNQVAGSEGFNVAAPIHGDDFLSTINFYGIAETESDIGNVDFHLTVTNHAHLKFHGHNSFTFVNANGESHKVRIPCIPHPPIGYENGCRFIPSYDNGWHRHEVVVDGNLRGYDNERAAYVEWWFKTVSALVNRRVVFMYEVSNEEPVAKTFDFTDDKEARVEVLKKYFSIMFAWYKKCEEFIQKEQDLLKSKEYTESDWDEKDELFFDFTRQHQPDFQTFVVKFIQEKEKSTQEA